MAQQAAENSALSNSELEHKGVLLALKLVAFKGSELPISAWKLSDFQAVSDQIFEVAKIQLNAKTLKLLYKKAESGELLNPHLSTKHALVNFLGYPDWNSFLQQEFNQTAVEPQVEKTKDLPSEQPKKRRFFKEVLLGSLIGLFVALGIYLFRLNNIDKPTTKGKFWLSTNEGFSPLAIRVHYKFEGDIPDSAVVTSGISNEKHEVNPSVQGSFMQSYPKPGVFNISLKYRGPNGKMVEDTHTKVYAYNKNWYLSISDAFDKQLVQDLPEVKDGVLGISVLNNDLKEAMYRSKLRLGMLRCMPYDVSMDSLDFFVRLKNIVPTNLLHSRECVIRLEGETGRHQIQLVDIGYESWFTWTQFCDTSYNNVDQTNYFVVPTNKWVDLHLRINNKNGYVIMNGKKPFYFNYRKPGGKLRSIALWFRGLGVVDSINVKKNNGTTVYENGF